MPRFIGDGSGTRQALSEDPIQEAPGSAAIRSPAPRGSRAKGAVVASLVLIVVLGVLGTMLKVREGGQLGLDPKGTVAPDFRLPLLDGKGTLALSDLKGKPVLLNFWASWCAPCKEEAPVLAAGFERWSGRGVVFLGVNEQDSRTWAQQFEGRYGIRYRSVVDSTGSVMARYGVLGFPETFFIDGNGRIKAKWTGPMDRAILDRYLDALVSGQEAS